MSEKQSKLRVYITEQLKRLEVFRDWRMMDESGRREYRRWIEGRTNDTAKVERLVGELVSLEELQTIAATSRIWDAIYPPVSTISVNCPVCSGSGFRIVVRSDGISGASRCVCRAVNAQQGVYA